MLTKRNGRVHYFKFYMKSNLSVLFFMGHTFGVTSKISSPNLSLVDLLCYIIEFLYTVYYYHSGLSVIFSDVCSVYFIYFIYACRTLYNLLIWFNFYVFIYQPYIFSHLVLNQWYTPFTVWENILYIFPFLPNHWHILFFSLLSPPFDFLSQRFDRYKCANPVFEV